MNLIPSLDLILLKNILYSIIPSNLAFRGTCVATSSECFPHFLLVLLSDFTSFLFFFSSPFCLFLFNVVLCADGMERNGRKVLCVCLSVCTYVWSHCIRMATVSTSEIKFALLGSA